MADLGNWTSEFVTIFVVDIHYLCFKMIFLMMIQLVTGQWWPTVEHPAKNKENVQWNESERNKSSPKFNQSKKLFQIEINFWTKKIWEFILNFIGPYYIGHGPWIIYYGFWNRWIRDSQIEGRELFWSYLVKTAYDAWSDIISD